MRDPKRIKKFCKELAEIWETNCPDWRFGQFICNVMGVVQQKHGDIFFPEEADMIKYIREVFEKEDSQND